MIRVYFRGFGCIPTNYPEKVYSALGSVLSMATRDLTNGTLHDARLEIDYTTVPPSIEIQFDDKRRTSAIEQLSIRIRELFKARFAVDLPVVIRPVEV